MAGESSGATVRKSLAARAVWALAVAAAAITGFLANP
jgi:hypothetical protein